jgi:HPt (histidine-containing phosphotransfer) domain-containing protein
MPEPDDIQHSIDPMILESILEMVGGGQPGETNDFINSYLADAAVLLDTIQQAFNQQNGKELVQSAHTLKSTSAQVGAVRLAELCRQIEEMAKEDAFESIDGLSEQVKDEYERVKIAMGEWKQ